MPPFARDVSPAILLVDNGSLKPAATLNLRAIASRLSSALVCPVDPISLLHSDIIPPGELGGREAEILGPALERRLRAGTDDFLVVPLFFGPSGALTNYLPERISLLKAKYPRLQVRIASPLVDPAEPGDRRMAAILDEQVRSVLPVVGPPPGVILVDHGSPVQDVTRVRNHLAAQLQASLGGTVRSVLAASMERRLEPEYSFNEPLLERALDQPGFNSGTVIVALLFLSPGRHAGPDGDIAQICAVAEQRRPQLKTVVTDPIGSHAGLIPILIDRVRAGLTRAPL